MRIGRRSLPVLVASLALAAALTPTAAGSTIVAGAATAAGLLTAAGAGSAAAAPDASKPKRLTDEATLTTWAHPEALGAIYARPARSSRRVANVRLVTPDGFAEVYLVLASLVDGHGLEWAQVRIPGRPNGRTGWLPREDLGALHQTHWRIVVDRAQRRMTVYYAGRMLRVFPVGVGKPSTPTPAGHFWVDERFKLSNPSSPYWPYALGTSDYSTLPDWPGEGVIGIHGPYGEPQEIPGDPSHGCIRMLAPDIAWLGPRVTLGTPVDVT
jgi:hypothetical protein